MKKKLFCILMVLILPISILLVGCGDGEPQTINNNENEWLEVQSISYIINNEEYTQTSQIKYNVENIESITWEEYESAPSDYKIGTSISDFYSNAQTIDIFKNEIKTANKYVGNICYFASIYDSNCSKGLISSYEIYYLKVRFMGSDILEINYYDNLLSSTTTSRIKPTSYEITYFND